MQSFNEKSDKREGKQKKSVFYRHKSYDINKYWKPGMPLTEEDLQMLMPVKSFYEENGYTPTKDDIIQMQQLKARFRTWNNVLLAAGLPNRNDPENQQKRMKAVGKNTAD